MKNMSSFDLSTKVTEIVNDRKRKTDDIFSRAQAALNPHNEPNWYFSGSEYMKSGDLVYGDPRSILVVDIMYLRQWSPLYQLIFNGRFYFITTIITHSIDINMPPPAVRANISNIFFTSMSYRINQWISLDLDHFSEEIAHATACNGVLVWNINRRGNRLLHYYPPAPRQFMIEFALLPRNRHHHTLEQLCRKAIVASVLPQSGYYSCHTCISVVFYFNARVPAHLAVSLK